MLVNYIRWNTWSTFKIMVENVLLVFYQRFVLNSMNFIVMYVLKWMKNDLLEVNCYWHLDTIRTTILSSTLSKNIYDQSWSWFTVCSYSISYFQWKCSTIIDWTQWFNAVSEVRNIRFISLFCIDWKFCLFSFPQCYAHRFEPLIDHPQGVPLEHYISCTMNFQYVKFF